jgi:hypothetical protein
VHQKTKREFCVEMLCLREVILHSQASTKLRNFHSLIIIAIDKSFKNSIENILNHPYLYRIYVSCIKIELLSVWTQICTCFANLYKLVTIGFYTSGMTADLACQLYSCLRQDCNILLLFKRDILCTGNVEYIFLRLYLKQKNYKD